MSRKLSQVEIPLIRDRIERMLRAVTPDVFDGPDPTRPGGVKRIADHLDALVEIVRRTRTTRTESFLYQILEDICSKCPFQLPSEHCPLRNIHKCALYRCAPAVVEAIADELVLLQDADYLATHPECRAS